MPKLIEIADNAKIVLVSGTVCSGRYTIGAMVSEKLKTAGYNCEFVSIREYLAIVGKLDESSPKEAYDALFKGKENSPWLVNAIANVMEIEGEEKKITVVSGLGRKCDAEYFGSNFPNSNFISIMADDDSLVERILARNKAKDFPQGTPENQKREMAKKLISAEKGDYIAMMGYITSIPIERTYVIDNGKGVTVLDIESKIYHALHKFNLV